MIKCDLSCAVSGSLDQHSPHRYNPCHIKITVKKDDMMLPMHQIAASRCWTHNNASQSEITVAKWKWSGELLLFHPQNITKTHLPSISLAVCTNLCIWLAWRGGKFVCQLNLKGKQVNLWDNWICAWKRKQRINYGKKKTHHTFLPMVTHRETPWECGTTKTSRAEEKKD